MELESRPRKAAPNGRPHLSRRQALVRVIQCLEQHERTPMALTEIYEAAGVSQRSLRTMFIDVFGVTPTRYLRLRRLHQLHTALVMADPALCTVAELCAHFELNDAGRAARDYQRLFGEPPSHTLARRLST